jgi:hypothetical protein
MALFGFSPGALSTAINQPQVNPAIAQLQDVAAMAPQAFNLIEQILASQGEAAQSAFGFAPQEFEQAQANIMQGVTNRQQQMSSLASQFAGSIDPQQLMNIQARATQGMPEGIAQLEAARAAANRQAAQSLFGDISGLFGRTIGQQLGQRGSTVQQSFSPGGSRAARIISG